MLSFVKTGLKNLKSKNFITYEPIAVRHISTAQMEEESQFTDVELSNFKDVFVRYDLDQNCKLDRWEFNKFARTFIGRSYYSTDLNKVFCKIDKNKDDYVDWEELHNHLSMRFQEQSKQRMVIAFNMFDKNGDGLIHWWETKQALFYLGEDSAADNIRYKYDLMDHDQDEQLTFQQFLRFICEHLKKRD